MTALNTIRDITNLRIREPVTLTEQERMLLYIHSWVIIDQLHMLLRLLIQIDRERNSEHMKRFSDRYAVASAIRNKMDHIDINISNIANTKKKNGLAFGALSYFVVDEIKEDGSFYGRVIAVSFGSLLLPNQSFTAANPAGKVIGYGASFFEFCAFGLILPFYELFGDLPALASYLDEEIKHRVDAYIEEREKAGENVEKMRGQPGRGLVIVFAVTAKDDSMILHASPRETRP